MRGILVGAVLLFLMGAAFGQDMTGQYISSGPPKTVHYDLYITDTVVHYTGKVRHAIAVNGTIPGPTLTFTEGDTAEVYVHNLMKKEETDLERKLLAENKWSELLRHMHSGSFFNRVKDMFRRQ